MLDISIKALDKTVKTRKAAADFIRKHVVVVEKIDGTKLTLIRNGEKFDPRDYTKNWIVSYKGSVIYPTEFVGLEKRTSDIRQRSIGSAQYKFVHDHLATVHSDTASIPLNTEFFVEFVQNKPTITRDYAKKHGLFLVGFGPSSYATSHGMIYSASKFSNDPRLLEEYAEILRLGQFPVVFEGNLSSRDEIFNADRLDPGLKALLEKNLETTDFSDPQDILTGVINSFRELQSSLGGKAEGVVIKVGGDDVSEQQLYKVLSLDQHDPETRRAKKGRYQTSAAEEKIYWENINSKVDEILDREDADLRSLRPEEIMRRLSSRAYEMSQEEIGINHPYKSLINIQEDLLLTAKLRVFTQGHRAKKIAIIPMAGKPFHLGHQMLIDKAIEDGNDLVIVYLSTMGREEISSSDMVPLWRDYYLPGLQREYGNRVIIRFLEGSPMFEVLSSITNLTRQSDKTVVRLYGDEFDAPERVKEILKKNPALDGKVVAVPLSRKLGANISGTEMRRFLASGDKEAFLAGLPNFLDDKAKHDIWQSLSKIVSPTNENLIRHYVRSLLL
jgi:hypothetical protein